MFNISPKHAEPTPAQIANTIIYASLWFMCSSILILCHTVVCALNYVSIPSHIHTLFS